jgi:multiple sugar transport system substrate-binding protein
MVSKGKKRKSKLPSKVKNMRKNTVQVFFLSLLLVLFLSSIICRCPFEENQEYRTILDVVFAMFVPITFQYYVKTSKTLKRRIIFHISTILLILALAGNYYYSKFQMVTLNVVGNSYKGLEDEIRDFNEMQKKEGKKIRAKLIRDWSGYFDTNKRWEEAQKYLQDEKYSVDVIELDGIWIRDVLSLPDGGLYQLDELYNPNFIKNRRFVQKAFDVGKHGGHQYAIPLYIDVGLIFYRKDVYENILNSDEFRDIYDAKNKLLKFKKGLKDFGRLINEGLNSGKDYEGLVFQGGPYEGLICSFIEFLRINGGEILYEHGKILLDPEKEKIKETIIFIRNGIYTEKFIPPSIFGYDEGESRDSFYDKYSVMLRNWPFILQMGESNLYKNVGILKIDGSAPVLGGWYLAIPKRSEHRKEAWELIKYLTNTNSQRMRAMHKDVSKRRLPSDWEALKMIKEESSWIWLGDVIKAIETAKPRPQIPRYMIFSKIFSKKLYRILSNSRIKNEEIPKMIKECQNSINKAISKGSN